MLVFCSNGSYAVMIFMRKVSLYKSQEHASFQAQFWMFAFARSIIIHLRN